MLMTKWYLLSEYFPSSSMRVLTMNKKGTALVCDYEKSNNIFWVGANRVNDVYLWSPIPTVGVVIDNLYKEI